MVQVLNLAVMYYAVEKRVLKTWKLYEWSRLLCIRCIGSSVHLFLNILCKMLSYLFLDSCAVIFD
jgi:hypothetical protein